MELDGSRRAAPRQEATRRPFAGDGLLPASVAAVKNVPLLLTLAFFAAAAGDAAKAGDAPPTKASVPAFYDWTGAYVGGHVGYTRGSAWVTVSDPDVAQFRQPLGSLTGGLQVGYNLLLPSRFLLGI